MQTNGRPKGRPFCFIQVLPGATSVATAVASAGICLAGLAHRLREVWLAADEAAVDHGIAFIDDRPAGQEPDKEMASDARIAGGIAAKQDGPAIDVPLVLGVPMLNFLHLPAELVGVKSCL